MEYIKVWTKYKHWMEAERIGVSVGWERDVRRASRSDGLPTMSAMETTRGRRLVRYSLLTLIGVPVGFVLAVRAGRAGSDVEARRAILWHGAALFFILLVVINGATENIMTTRPATVKWLLLPAQVAIAAGVVMLCRRRARPLQ